MIEWHVEKRGTHRSIQGTISAVNDDAVESDVFGHTVADEFGTFLENQLKATCGFFFFNDGFEREELFTSVGHQTVQLAVDEFLDLREFFQHVLGDPEVTSTNNEHVFISLVGLDDIFGHIKQSGHDKRLVTDI